MRLALVQLNPIVGDLAGNASRLAAFAAKARDAGADLAVFPELCLCGYPPKDLILQEGFVEACADEAKMVGAAHSRGLTLVFGVPLPVSEPRPGVANSLLAYRDGEMIAYHDKRLLPTYDVFDEDRYFVPGDRAVVIDVAGVKVGLSICEDLWKGQDVGFADRYADAPDPVEALVRAGAQVIINPSASPFVLGKGKRHRDILRTHATRHRVTVAAVNQVGGNDELVFDGHACVFDPTGRLVAAAKGFEESMLVVDLPVASATPELVDPLLSTADAEHLYRALVLGVRDYLYKTGFKSAVLGLSGGIDSAVTAVIACAALGPRAVLGVSMPSRYSSEGSKRDAHALAENLGMPMITVPIEESFGAMERTLAPVFAGRAADVTEENLQSRLRGTIVMSISNKLGHLTLTTGNKSEMAVGYCTLYGDMNGGLAVLADVDKQWVYTLAKWINANPSKSGIEGLGTRAWSSGTEGPIPAASITKPPSAELRPNQTDQDSLPPYEILDRIIERYIEQRESPARIVRETGIDASTVARVVRMIDASEFKRKQAAIGLKVTSVAFGSGRRMPIAQGYRPDRGLAKR